MLREGKNMSDENMLIQELKNKIKKFVQERDWEKFHSPKNLSMSLSIEVAELMEHFQWVTIEQSKEIINNPIEKEKIQDEIADIAVYLLNLCNVLGVDMSEAITTKLKKNGEKYPVDLVKGKSHKYTYYTKE